MKLISLVLYNSAGDQVELDFRPGLNIITGVSATGKSAVLDMVEYCLGRDTLIMPVGPITDSVIWYGLVVELPSQRAFIGRPAPARGNVSSSQAMLEFGAFDRPPSLDSLHVNADTRSVRSQIGRALGIDENETDPEGPLQQSYEANLGHAVLLCLQRQSEIANREFLFHRQGEDGIGRAIQATLPYFLGAIAQDRAVLRQRLLAARRALRSAEADMRRAEAADEQLDVAVHSLTVEAQTVGLLPDTQPSGTAEALSALRAAATASVSPVALDDEEEARRSELFRQREDLRQQLRQAGEERAILDSLKTDEAAYDATVGRQVSRLRSLELLGEVDGSSHHCPICNSELDGQDPTITELVDAASELRSQLGAHALSQPRRNRALSDLAQRIDRLRAEIRSIDETITSIETVRSAMAADRRYGERQAFLQGRIHRFLETASLGESHNLDRLRQQLISRQATVNQLEGQLDPDEEREQLVSRLAAVSRDMTAWADQLGLEHSGIGVRLDLKRLTVVADTTSGPAALNRIGSAGNWIGYHLVAHLALHKYFTTENRPVPRFLILDQPTQAYYPSDVDQESGVPRDDDDRAAVQAMFELIKGVVDELGNQFQVIVCDHANLPDGWFQDSVIANWRDGRRLIPNDWTETDDIRQ